MGTVILGWPVSIWDISLEKRYFSLELLHMTLSSCLNYRPTNEICLALKAVSNSVVSNQNLKS